MPWFSGLVAFFEPRKSGSLSLLCERASVLVGDVLFLLLDLILLFSESFNLWHEGFSGRESEED